jgi:hypothetical protein
VGAVFQVALAAAQDKAAALQAQDPAGAPPAFSVSAAQPPAIAPPLRRR